MLASPAQASELKHMQSREIGEPKVSAHKSNWFRKLLYEWSCHTSIEEALRWAKAQGRRAGCALCPRCMAIKLNELESGLFTCPKCRMDTDTEIMRIRTGALMRAWPNKTTTQEIEAIRAKNGTAYQQRLTQRLQWQPEEGEKA